MNKQQILHWVETRFAGLKNIPTGRAATMSIWTLMAIYSLSVVTSLPGLAVSPILGDLESVFKDALQLEIQMLTSLPSLIIIPCVLIAGRLSVNLNKKKMMIWGLSIFFISSLLYLVVDSSLTLMLINSVVLGVGAGVVVPLSTGLIADFFSGRERTKQLGIASGISNLSLVLATMLAGYLAGINWHYSFLVYCISAISLAFAFTLKEPKTATAGASKIASSDGTSPQTAAYEPKPKAYLNGRITTDWPLNLMGFYFLITTIVLVVPFNLSIYMTDYKIGGTDASGTLISVFFLAITIPGFFINRIITKVPRRNNLYSLGIMLVGLMLFLVHDIWSLTAGVVLTGFGYGTMQPLVYDRTADAVRASRVTFALALVMAMNYSAIITYPFFQKIVELLVGTKSPYVAIVMSIVICGVLLGVNYVAFRGKKE